MEISVWNLQDYVQTWSEEGRPCHWCSSQCKKSEKQKKKSIVVKRLDKQCRLKDFLIIKYWEGFGLHIVISINLEITDTRITPKPRIVILRPLKWIFI